MSPEKRYAINEIFYTLQGEGVRAGCPSVFVRFSGCNLACDLEPSDLSPGGWRCDTEFTSGRLLTADEILDEIQVVAQDCRWLVLTGGEPTLQLDIALVERFRSAGYQLAMETNGTKNVDALHLDWVCVSPKTAEHTLEQLTAQELKYVRHVRQGIPKPRGTAEHYLISPAFEADGSVRQDTLQWCIHLCKDHPAWRLSLQLHKFLRIR